MAGDEINIADNALMMIHDPHGMTAGGAADMRKTADLLDQVKGVIADTYVKRTGQPSGDVLAWMSDETWFGAADAVANGFADNVTAEQKIAACHGFDFSNFKRTPVQLTGEKRSAGHSMAAVKLVAMNTRLR
jgi:ATP-dependent protease ClpP protease subunit